MLFEPDRHEALSGAAWDESRARDAIGAITHDIEQQHAALGHWPVHPLDVDGDLPIDGFKSLYLGSAGVWSRP